MAVGREQSSWIAHVAEPTADTLTRASPFELTLTGWSSNNQVDSAQLSSATISDYIGNVVEFLDGNVQGERARIRTFDGTNTITFDPVTHPSPTATRARMWVPPDPSVPVTAVGTSATVVSALRTEADDYWNDPDRMYLVVEGGGGAGTAARGDAPRLIADFDAATDTFTIGTAFPATPTIGDLLLLRQPIKPASAELPYAQTGLVYIDRKFVKGTWDRDPGVMGPRGAQPLSITLEALGASTAASGAIGAIPPLEAHDLLHSLFVTPVGTAMTRVGDGSSTTTAGSTATSINVTTGTGPERFSVGNVVLVNGSAAYITAITDGGGGDDILTIAPALPVAPVAGVTVFGAINYRPRRDATAAWAATSGGFRSHTVEAYLNGMRKLYYGWHFDLEIGGLTQNTIPSFTFAGPYDTCLVNSVANLYTPTYTTTLPRPSKAARAVLGGTVSSTLLEASVKVGYDIQPVASVAGTIDGRNGHMVVGRNTTGTMRIWMEDASHWNALERAAEQSLLIQVGSVQAGSVVFAAPAIQYTGVELAREAGGYSANIAFNVLRSGIASVDDFVVACI